jgi:hypothetical protein
MSEENLLIADVPEGIIQAESNRPENIPAKFWDAKKEEIRVDALLSSYK